MGNRMIQVFPLPLGLSLTVDAEFFVRQKYFSTADDIHFATLSPRDISPLTPCPCTVCDLLEFSPGDFVLMQERSRLQPYRFECYVGRSSARLRELPRRREFE